MKMSNETPSACILILFQLASTENKKGLEENRCFRAQDINLHRENDTKEEETLSRSQYEGNGKCHEISNTFYVAMHMKFHIFSFLCFSFLFFSLCLPAILFSRVSTPWLYGLGLKAPI
jgi:hypothetical protein